MMIFSLTVKTEIHGFNYLNEIIKCSKKEEQLMDYIINNYDNFKKEIEFFDAGHWLETIDLKKTWLNKTEIHCYVQNIIYDFSNSLFSHILFDYIFDDDDDDFFNDGNENIKNKKIKYNKSFDELDMTYKKKLNKFYKIIKK